MHTKKTLLVLLLAIATAISAPAFAEPTQGAADGAVDGAPTSEVAETDTIKNRAMVRQRLEFLLSGYEYFPSRKDLDHLAPPSAIVTLLKEMAHEADLRPTMRLRAVDALSLYEGDEVRDFLTAVLAIHPDEVEPDQLRVTRLMRHRAINSLARLDAEKAVDTLRPFLEDSDLQIRLTAISALGQFGGEAGKKAIEDLRARDTHPAVQREINKHL